MSHTPLDTYDSNWEACWDQANNHLLSLQPGLSDFGPGYGDRGRAYAAALKTLHDAYHAQFRTVEEYRDHGLYMHEALAHGTNIKPPRFPDGADLPTVRALFLRYRDDIDAARRQADAERAIPA